MSPFLLGSGFYNPRVTAPGPALLGDTLRAAARLSLVALPGPRASTAHIQRRWLCLNPQGTHCWGKLGDAEDGGGRDPLRGRVGEGRGELCFDLGLLQKLVISKGPKPSSPRTDGSYCLTPRVGRFTAATVPLPRSKPLLLCALTRDEAGHTAASTAGTLLVPGAHSALQASRPRDRRQC